jgi:hypothetical protein
MKASRTPRDRSPVRAPVGDDRRIEFWVGVTAAVAVSLYLPLAAGAIPRLYAPSPVTWSLNESDCPVAGSSVPISEHLIPWGAQAKVSWSTSGGTRVTYLVFQHGNQLVPNTPTYTKSGFSGSWTFVSDGLTYAFQATPARATSGICATDYVTTVLTYSLAI